MDICVFYDNLKVNVTSYIAYSTIRPYTKSLQQCAVLVYRLFAGKGLLD